MSKRKSLNLTYERLAEVLSYNEVTGVFYWKSKPSKFSPVCIGDIAGSLHKPSGYLRISIDSERYVCHRLAWLFTYKSWPDGDIDHVNGDRSDNRITNLREAEDKNCWNASIRTDNSSGVKGVSYHRGIGKYIARINYKGITFNLGVFETIQEAEIIVRKKREELHKEFANHG